MEKVNFIFALAMLFLVFVMAIGQLINGSFVGFVGFAAITYIIGKLLYLEYDD